MSSAKLTEKEAKTRIAKLRNQINDYRYHYHVLDESTMPEAAADSLKHELTRLEEAFPELITPDSPTQRVAGGIADGFKKVSHLVRMLSLNDVFNFEELESWRDRIKKLAPGVDFQYFADIKLDGLACSLIYIDGVLDRAVSRGDGFVGEDITTNARTLQSIPLTLQGGSKGTTEVRGEIVLYSKDFDKINKQLQKNGQKEYANPRNLAAGTMRQLDSSLVAARPLKFFAYDLMTKKDSESNASAYQALKELGFKTSGTTQVFPTLKKLEGHIQKWQQKRESLPFNTDGFVVKINDRKIYKELGVVGKAPRGAVAYKYPAEQTTTKVKDIFISVGRTGSATPVAILEPVSIAGSTVQMATLHNADEVKRKDIRIGDTVILEKAGDIIPAVVRSLPKLRTGSQKPFKFPISCPECQAKLVKSKEEDAIWRCPNNSCPARISKKIQHFASRGAMNIEGLGEKNVEALLDAGAIKDQADLYNLSIKDILNIERFADLSAKNLLQAIADKKNPPLAKFIYALGIRQVGAQTAIDLATHFGSLQKLSSADLDSLSVINGIGEVVAESIISWFGDPENQNLLDKFYRFGLHPQKLVLDDTGKLAGQNFVITGSLDSMSRDEAADKIRSLGGTFQSSVGKSTNYLVAGGAVGASKLKKAKQYSIKIISENDLINLIK